MNGIKPSWKNIIFVVSAPSGAGKTTLCDKLQTEFKDIHYAITATTRAPRPGEIDGKSYYFMSLPEFETKLAAGGFIENAVVHGNRYGSPKAPAVAALADGCDVLMNLDVQGAAAVREYIAAAPPGDPLKRPLVDIFVVPPSTEVLRNRLVARGTDSLDVIEQRMQQAREEISHWKEYKYMVVNDDLAEAYDHMRAIILAERHRIDNRREDYHA
ncbi:MAG: guanylate kinase [Kiritimatiellae bacterium]|jgi:guanylate kinase|nr:guanylate kinase [Kiritimatiellia bacterium]NLD89963.1 guanylate kinase [Lentisphaerota bacterium]HOU21481.1 guanylate kinase [Kiritimatiellia bacterium]HPC20033.1 guanylate kinase [Kiritimatiellia bacterium]HQN80395.1 guanylate kinase [Kiritimatiellia bacterium]